MNDAAPGASGFHHDNDLPVDRLTWAVLLGRWVSFARSATALPGDDAGRKIKAVVPDVIMLQAVWFALQHLDDLPPDEVALGLDRAQVLIEKHEGMIREQFVDGPMPAALIELIEDAHDQLRRAGGRKI